ncbi:MAG: hypothetical protein LBB79_02230 [Prevotellaceae bacterium]|nr:hypothetical protein [Prevotellaceae bacterium]
MFIKDFPAKVPILEEITKRRSPLQAFEDKTIGDTGKKFAPEAGEKNQYFFWQSKNLSYLCIPKTKRERAHSSIG